VVLKRCQLRTAGGGDGAEGGSGGPGGAGGRGGEGGNPDRASNINFVVSNSPGGHGAAGGHGGDGGGGAGGHGGPSATLVLVDGATFDDAGQNTLEPGPAGEGAPGGARRDNPTDRAPSGPDGISCAVLTPASSGTPALACDG
jgi:hypothetical protein